LKGKGEGPNPSSLSWKGEGEKKKECFFGFRGVQIAAEKESEKGEGGRERGGNGKRETRRRLPFSVPSTEKKGMG